MPRWEFSPVVGLNLSDTTLNLPPGYSYFNVSNGTSSGNYNLFLVYANVGFDYQAKDGFDLGFGFNIPLVNEPDAGITGIVIPGLNIGKFF